MFTVIIAFILFIVGLTTGYAMRPKLDRKISYKKRGQATRKRAAAKRAAKPKPMTMPVESKDAYLGSNSVNFGNERLN